MKSSTLTIHLGKIHGVPTKTSTSYFPGARNEVSTKKREHFGRFQSVSRGTNLKQAKNSVFCKKHTLWTKNIWENQTLWRSYFFSRFKQIPLKYMLVLKILNH